MGKKLHQLGVFSERYMAETYIAQKVQVDCDIQPDKQGNVMLEFSDFVVVFLKGMIKEVMTKILNKIQELDRENHKVERSLFLQLSQYKRNNLMEQLC